MRRIERLSRLGFSVLLLSGIGVAHAAHAGTVSPVFQIQGANDGAYPTGTLVEIDGKYYGVTTSGDIVGPTIYTIDLRTKKETVLYQFSDPYSGPSEPVVAFDGKLYGATFFGQSIYSFDPSTGAETTVYQLPSGYPNSALVARYGLLYGTGSGCGDTGGGCIFSVDPASGTGTILHSFAKAEEEVPTSLARHGDVFFGTTYNGKRQGQKKTFGTIFKFDPFSGRFGTVFSFTANGEGLDPNVGLIDVGGVLYGTTSSGGQSGDGTVFLYDPTSKKETVLYGFTGPTGANPRSGLLNLGGQLYGTTYDGGASGLGVVFSVDPASGQETVVHSFTAGECGNPRDALIEARGLLYGVMYSGGAANSGCIYSIDPATGHLSSVHQFAGPPYDRAAGLTKHGPELYGVAAGGGVFGLGSIFRFHPATGTGETLYSFDGTDGGRPSGALTEVGGLFYGTTATGGLANAGTVFSFDPKHRTMTTLYDFPGGAAGGGSSSHLAFAANTLFGIAGANAFSIDLATLRFRAIRLSSRSYLEPAPDLTAVNGLLYGVTEYGGTGRGGTIFSIDPATGSVTTRYTFPRKKDGAQPVSDLTYSNGLLYGLTASTGYPYYLHSTVFEFDPTTDTRTIVHVFRHTAMPTTLALVPAGDDLLGAAYIQQDADTSAAIMRLDPAADAVTYDDAMQLDGYPPVTPLLHTAHGFYFDTEAPCTACTTPTAGMLYKLTP